MAGGERSGERWQRRCRRDILRVLYRFSKIDKGCVYICDRPDVALT